MNNKVSLKKHLVLFLLLGCNTVAFSQLGTGISARKPALPTYSTPYVIPTVKDVKNIVDRIQQRVEKNSLFILLILLTDKRFHTLSLIKMRFIHKEHFTL